MITATAPTSTATTFAKLANGSWGIQGIGLVSGQTVTVTKRSGETSRVVVGDLVRRDALGNVWATIGQAPRVQNADKVTEIGFYLHEGVAYKVVKSGIGRLYAKKVTKNGFIFDGGAIDTLSASELMTAEEVRVYSRTIGICANCSVELSDPVSVEIGLGTHCGPGILGTDNYKAARKAARMVPAVAEALAKIAAEKKAAKAMVEAAKAADAAAAQAGYMDDLLAHFGA
jgi:hypothetical protein